jgi:hypothetical protein
VEELKAALSRTSDALEQYEADAIADKVQRMVAGSRAARGGSGSGRSGSGSAGEGGSEVYPPPPPPFVLSGHAASLTPY